MPIELPAPMTPALYAGNPSEFIQQSDGSVALQFEQYRIHLAGDVRVDRERLAQAVGAADTLSNAVRAIGIAHFLAGHPGMQLQYLLVGDDLYVHLAEPQLGSVKMAPELLPYFDDLAGAPPGAAALEPARALAAIRAERMGIDGTLRLDPGSAPNTVNLTLDESPRDPRPIGGSLGFGNPGNRYAGREFADAGARFTSGAFELTGTYRRGLNDQSDYNERGAALSLIAPQGLFGFDGRTVRYTLAPEVGASQGRTRHLGLQWSMLPAADFETRWLLTLRVDDSLDRLTDGTGEVLRNEEYQSLGVDLSRSQVWTDDPHGSELEIGLSVDAGSGDSDGEAPYATADDHFVLLRPNLSFRRDITERWTAGVELSGQYSAQNLPQQQQWVLGGPGMLSAWLPGVTVGDIGALLRIETGPDLDLAGLSVAPRLFAEIATWKLKTESADDTAGESWLADAGAELVVEAGQRLEASLSAAIPLPDSGGRNAAYDASRADAYFSITLRY